MAKNIRLMANCQRGIGLATAVIIIVAMISVILFWLGRGDGLYGIPIIFIFPILILAAYCRAILLKKQKAVLVILLIWIVAWVIPWGIYEADGLGLIELEPCSCDIELKPCSCAVNDIPTYRVLNLMYLSMWPAIPWIIIGGVDFIMQWLPWDLRLIIPLISFILPTFLLFIGWFGTKKLVRINDETSEILQEDNDVTKDP